MKNKKRKSTKFPDDSFLNNKVSAVSPEFVPSLSGDIENHFGGLSEQPFDIIPELKGQRFN